jgi:hypothetical protein
MTEALVVCAGKMVWGRRTMARQFRNSRSIFANNETERHGTEVLQKGGVGIVEAMT